MPSSGRRDQTGPWSSASFSILKEAGALLLASGKARRQGTKLFHMLRLFPSCLRFERWSLPTALHLLFKLRLNLHGRVCDGCMEELEVLVSWISATCKHCAAGNRLCSAAANHRGVRTQNGEHGGIQTLLLMAKVTIIVG